MFSKCTPLKYQLLTGTDPLVVCRPPIGKEKASTNQRPFCYSMKSDRGHVGEGLSQSEAFLPLGAESTIVCYWRPI